MKETGGTIVPKIRLGDLRVGIDLLKRATGASIDAKPQAEYLLLSVTQEGQQSVGLLGDVHVFDEIVVKG